VTNLGAMKLGGPVLVTNLGAMTLGD